MLDRLNKQYNNSYTFSERTPEEIAALENTTTLQGDQYDLFDINMDKETALAKKALGAAAFKAPNESPLTLSDIYNQVTGRPGMDTGLLAEKQMNKMVSDVMGTKAKTVHFTMVPINDITPQGTGQEIRGPGDQSDAYLNELIAQIKQDGAVFNPVLLDRDNNIIEGYHRVAALKELGVKEVPALRLLGDDTTDSWPNSIFVTYNKQKIFFPLPKK